MKSKEIYLTYKIIILDFLEAAGFPVSNSQICDFMVESGITDYFTTQEIISDIAENRLVDTKFTNNNTFYIINKKGTETLSLFPERISDGLRDDIKSYFNKHGLDMKQSNSLLADFDRISDSDYICHLRIFEEERNIFQMSLHVTTRSAAETICTNWKVRYDDIFEHVLDRLMN